MSWHHEDYINLVTSIGGLATAIFAYKSILESKKIAQSANTLQSTTNQREHHKFIYDELKQRLEVVNKLVNGKDYNDWTFETAVSIANMIYSATEFIEQTSQASSHDLRIFKRYFLKNLEQPIRHVFETFDSEPDAFYRFENYNHNSVQHSQVAIANWNSSREYFGYGPVTDEDLAD
ncbi:hypothetical protein [Rosenbergiella epipactidis]|uniref:hypothetical protein n=1 Tax=Rosenbergiella epipactidis TaxID=1544694 RepID=UPI001F4F80E2|nr:hypothetical protein [Rosenbergiella epipactidis]